MLGDILSALTDAVSAEEALAAVGDPAVVARVRRDAAAEGVDVGTFVACTVCHVLDHAGEEVWLDLLGRMSGSLQPGVTALEVMLARAFAQPLATGVKPHRS
jgi:cytochrome c2